jgi:hypothetical protein
LFFNAFEPVFKEPKKSFPAGGSVQHYFYESLQSLWNAGFSQKLRELKMVGILKINVIENLT